MRIKRLVIKDCLGIEELAFDVGKVNVITGGNEKGKTSILETIEKAITNTKRRARFVRTGADQAYIEFATDTGLNVKRVIKEDEQRQDFSSVKITQDGAPISREPETYLKKLVGITSKKAVDMFSFNPIDFMMKDEKDQTQILLGMMPMTVTQQQAQEWFGIAPKVNYDKHGLQVIKDIEQNLYDMRHEINTRVAALEDEVAAVHKRLPDNYDLTQWQGVELGKLFDELRAAEASNRERIAMQKIIDEGDRDLEAVRNRHQLRIEDVAKYRTTEDVRIQESAQAQREAVKQELNERKAAIDDQIAGLNGTIKDLQDQIRTLEMDKVRLKERRDNLDKIDLTNQEDGILKEAQAKTIALNKEVAEKVDAITTDREGGLKAVETRIGEAKFFLETTPEKDTTPYRQTCAEAEKMKSFIPLASELQALQKTLDGEKLKAEFYDTALEKARAKPKEILASMQLPLKGMGIDNMGYVTIDGLPVKNMSTSKQVRVCLDIARAYAKDNPLKLIMIDKLESLTGEVYDEFRKQMDEDPEFQYFCAEASVVRDENGKVVDDGLKVQSSG